MKCVKCGARKGKRSCPALAGDICPQCCGEHRLKSIACPGDCTWLGGLAAVLSTSTVPPEDVLNALPNANDALVEWVQANARDVIFAVGIMHQVFPVPPTSDDDWLASLVFAASCVGVADGNGKRAVDHFIAAKARDLRPVDVAAAKALAQARLRPLRVLSVEGESCIARDLLDDKPVKVRDIVADSIKPGEAIAMMLVPLGPGDEHVSIADAFIQPSCVDKLIEELKAIDYDASPAAKCVPFLVKLREAGPVLVEQ